MVDVAHNSATMPAPTTTPPTPMTTIDAARAAHAHLADGERSEGAVSIGPLRALRRQRFGRSLQFLMLRDGATGREIEGILSAKALNGAALSGEDAEYQLGDAVRVSGPLEMRRGKLSIVVQQLEVVEAWAEVFEGAPYSDWGADGASADAYARGNVLLQCTGSHAERLRAYLAEVLGLETLAVLLPVGGGAKSGKGVRVLLVHAPRPSELFAALRADPNVARVVQRWYPLPRRHATLADAFAAVAAELRDARGADGAAVAVRVHAFPRPLERRLALELAASGVAVPTPQGAERCVCAAFALGGYLVGVAPTAEVLAAGALAEKEAAKAEISRAYFKLREACVRCGISTLGAVRHAVDVGAAPGGWSAYLAAEGAARVTAIDPGLLVLPDGTPRAGAIVHMRQRWEAALAVLLERNDAIDFFCCDMNVRPHETVDLLAQALPLLARGAAFVLTFKNGYKRTADWEAALAEQKARLATLAGDPAVRELHLMANTANETTLIGRVGRGGGGGGGGGGGAGVGGGGGGGGGGAGVSLLERAMRCFGWNSH